MHAHSDMTGEPYMRRNTPRRVIQGAFDRGLDVLNISDYRLDGFLDSIASNPEKNLPPGTAFWGGTQNDGYLHVRGPKGENLLLLRGMEWPNSDGSEHVLSVGHRTPIKHDPDAKISIPERAKIIKDHGGLVGAAHGFNVAYGGMGYNKLLEYADILDFFEVGNPLNTRNQMLDRLVRKLAIGQDMPGLVNSDSHDPHHIGMAHTVLDVDFDGSDPWSAPEKMRERVLQAVLTGDREFVLDYISQFSMGKIFIGQRILYGALERDGVEIKRGFDLIMDALKGK